MTFNETEGDKEISLLIFGDRGGADVELIHH